MRHALKIIVFVSYSLYARQLFSATAQVGGFTWSYQIVSTASLGTYAEICPQRALSGGSIVLVPTITPKPKGAISVPSSLGGKPVKSIAANAFTGCTELTCVTIPTTVANVSYYAFNGCSALTAINVNNGNIKYKSDNGFLLDSDNSLIIVPSGLKKVEIPSIATRIGIYAFASCTSLENAKIPDSVTSIGKNAFENCGALTSLIIPNSVTNVEECAFYQCSGLKKISILNPDIKVSSSAFSRCSNVSDATVPGWKCNIPFGSVTNLVISNTSRKISVNAFTNCVSIFRITITDSVKTIGANAFGGCVGLKDLRIGNSVEIISDGAFSNCTALTSVTIPKSLTSIGKQVFYDCDNLTHVGVSQFVCSGRMSSMFPSLYKRIKTVEFDESVKSIGNSAFSGCTSLTNIALPNAITNIGNYAFSDCSGLTGVSLPDAVVHIGQWAFSGCTSLTNIALPNAITNIGNYAFSDCNGLTSVSLPDSLVCIGDYAFSDCNILTDVTIPNGVVTIGDYAFYHCKSLKNVSIPDSVEIIGDAAFSSCSGLESVTILTGNACIGEDAFADCSGLTAVHISDIASWCSVSFEKGSLRANPIYTAHNLYIGDELVTELIIPEGVTNIAAGAFHSCKNITNVKIADSVVSIGNFAFAFEGCDSICDTKSIPGVKLLDGWAIGHTSALSGMLDLTGIRGIADQAFYECRSLTCVTIPNNVTRIGPYTFDYCSGLTSVTIPDGVTSICVGAFENCGSLTNITLGSDVSYISGFAFECCYRLEGITFMGDAPEVISEYAFHNIGPSCVMYVNRYANGFIPDKNGRWYNHTIEYYGPVFTIDSNGTLTDVDLAGETEVRIPRNITSIGDKAFSQCHNKLKSVNIPTSVTNIASCAFEGCSGLTSVKLPDSLISIGSSAFSGCSSLTDIAVPDSVKSIGNSAFAKCASLVEVSLPFVGACRGNTGSADSLFGYIFGTSSFPGGVRINQYYSSSSYASTYCYIPTNLTTVVITDEMVLGHGAFMNCDKLVSVTIPASVNRIGDEAFRGCSRLMSMTFPDGVVSIGDYMFFNCRSLTRAIFPDSVTNIGVYAFAWCRELANVTIPASAARIGDSAFSSCHSITNVTLPDSLTAIGREAFSNCSGLTSVTIPSGVISIGDQAFSYCSSLTNIVFDGNAPIVGTSSFSNVDADCTAFVLPRSPGWDVEIPGIWNGIQIDYRKDGSFFIPQLATDANPESVTNAISLAGFADSGVMAVIDGMATEYASFKSWASGVAGGEAAVVASTNAVVSYLLGAERLFVNAPEIEFEECNVASDTGEVTVSITVKDGEDAIVVASEKVKEMFEATSDLSDWNGAGTKLTPTVTDLTQGRANKLKFKVRPGDGTSSSAFLRIRK